MVQPLKKFLYLGSTKCKDGSISCDKQSLPGHSRALEVRTTIISFKFKISHMNYRIIESVLGEKNLQDHLVQSLTQHCRVHH